MDAVALTDNGSLYGVIEFYETCRKEGVKPIIGCELYARVGSSIYHLTALAEHYDGYKNLMRLASTAALDGLHENIPCVTDEMLARYRDGIIFLSGCKHGELAHIILSGDRGRAAARARELSALVGQRNFFLELQDHPDLPGQFQINEGLQQIARETGLPLVVTRDVHYLKPEDAQACDIVECIGAGHTVQEHAPHSLAQVDRSLSTPEQIQSRWRHLPEALENTARISARIDIQIPLNVWHFPPIEKAPDKTYDDMLHEQAYAGIAELLTDVTTEIRQRIDYELDVIKTKGYAPYFLAVADYIKWARDHGIVTTTRGSAAGSLVSYAIGIVAVNPLFFKLPFERFMNPFRPSPPDVDADFADDRREEVIAYVTEKYGRDRVAQIITFGTMAARASVRDAGRALGFSYGFCDRIAKLIPFGAQGSPMTIDKALIESPDLKKIYDEQEDVRRLLDIARKIEGNARHTSIHAAGVVISPQPLTEFTPVQYEVGGTHLTTQYEMNAVKKAGVLKMDFMGIRNLSILGNAIKLIKERYNTHVDLQRIPWDDKKTYEMLARGETGGVFQLNGAGMTRYLKELKPTTIFDIMAMVALFRPGPMESIPEYIRRKHNPSLVTYLDERLHKILDQSLGILVYQDDVLLTAIELAGYNWEEADKFRKAMGKKIPEEMAKQKLKFVAGCLERGLPQEKVNLIWQLIEPFAAYGFNKCVTGAARIVDALSGTLVRVDDLYRRKARLQTLGVREGIIRDVHARWVRRVGKKKVFTITTRSGRRITCTPNHRFMAFDGWVEASALRKGSRIAVARILTVNMRKKGDRHHLAVLGYLISEGNLCNPHGVYYYSKSKMEIADFIRHANAFKNVRMTIDRSKSAASVCVGRKKQRAPNELFDWCKELGLLGKKAPQKFLPPFLFTICRNDLAIFVAKLWQGDGCVSAWRYGSVFYATDSRELADGLQHLLLRFGIWSVVHTKKRQFRGRNMTWYAVHVSSYENLCLFEKWFGVYLLSDKRASLRKIIKKIKRTHTSIRRRGTSDTIPVDVLVLIRKEMAAHRIGPKALAKKAGVNWRLLMRDKKRKGFLRGTVAAIATALHSKALRQIATSHLYWDEVKDLIPAGIQETYDLTVPEIENFIANDFVTHNSHAASYAVVAYQTAYLKANYPVAYMCAVLAAESDDTDKIAEIVHECERMRMRMRVLPPDINESREKFSVMSGDGSEEYIRFGLSAVKNVGEHITQVIIAERDARGPFTSLVNFLERVRDKDLNKKSLGSLAKCGAFDAWGDRGLLLANMERILAFSHDLTAHAQSNQSSLLGMLGGTSTLVLQPAPLAPTPEKLKWEKELIGLYLSSHPFKPFAELFTGTTVALSHIEAEPAGATVALAGLVGDVKKKWTKNREPMALVRVEDLTGSAELLVFPKSYAATETVWQTGSCVWIVGQRSREEGDGKIFVEQAQLLDETSAGDARTQLIAALQKSRTRSTNARRFEKNGSVGAAPRTPPPPRLVITLPPDITEHRLQQLKGILATAPGIAHVRVRVQSNGMWREIDTAQRVEITDGLRTKVCDLIGKDCVWTE